MMSYPRLKEVRLYRAVNLEKPVELKFIEMLKQKGFILVTKPLKQILDDQGRHVAHKGNLDIELALDAYKRRSDYRTFVFFTGDSDFEVLIRELRLHSRHCVTISARQQLSRELFRSSNITVHLERFLKYIIRQ